MEIAGPQRHHEISKAYERGIGVGEQAHHHVTVQHRHGRLVAVLEPPNNQTRRQSFGSVPLTRMHSSRFFAGPQWNIPVLSYFISVFSKSKSLAWSSARPTGSATPLLFWLVPPLLLLVGLKRFFRQAGNERTVNAQTCTTVLAHSQKSRENPLSSKNMQQ